jgi:hypothetical protein
MPRAGWVKAETDQRLSDHISIGVLTRVFPPELVDRVVAEAGRTEQRHRLLPARVVVYYVLGLALFSQSSYEEVMRMLVEGLSWADGWAHEWNVPTKAALFKGRARLGAEPLEALFRAVAAPMATPDTKGAWYRGLRLMSLDGTCVDVADTEANDAAFGRPGSKKTDGISAYPQLRLVALAECGTHAIIDCAIGRYATAEVKLAPEVFGSLKPGMLALGDRGLSSFALWNEAKSTGADLLWRTTRDRVLPVKKRHRDGSFTSVIYPSQAAQRRKSSGLEVRVVEYELDDPGRGSTDTRYRLITTIADPKRAPADELAALYSERWEIELAFDELKSHQRSPRAVLRSKMPDGVVQELYGHLCVHHAIRWLMHSVATEADADPDRMSFTRAIRAARRSTASHPGFSP